MEDLQKGIIESAMMPLVNWGRNRSVFNGMDYGFVGNVTDRYSKATHAGYFSRPIFAFFYEHYSVMGFE